MKTATRSNANSGSGSSSTAGGASGGSAGPRKEPRESGGSTDFWFERSQAYAASTECARRVLDSVDDDGASGSALREAALELTGTVASAVSTARDQLPARLQEAYDRANAVAGIFVLHADRAGLSQELRQAIRENLSAVAGLLFGLRRSLTQER